MRSKRSNKNNRNNRNILIVGAVIIVAIVGLVLLQSGNSTGSSVQAITPAEYQSQFANSNTTYTLLDVRTPDEFNTGHIAGSVNISVETLQNRLSEVPRDQTIVVYCHSGNRSGQAAKILADAGYTKIRDLGGINAWTAAGYPIE